MKYNGLTELFWKKTKFRLLFGLCLVLLYIIEVTYVINVPRTDNVELLEVIDQFEKILDVQGEEAEKIKNIYEEIDSMEFNVYQVQNQNEIKKEITNIRSVYLKNELNSKFEFSILSADLLRIYYDTREENNAMEKRKKAVEENLKDCKGNIEH